jgi:hypothetical protein
MDASDTTQARQAALLLYGLRSTEREKVMARLSPAEVSRLQPLLAQLSELAIPRWQARQFEQLPGGELPNHELSALERTSRLGADAVLQALRRCSTSTAANLICAREWPWKEKVLEIGADQLLIAVAECARAKSDPLPPAVLESLCECLCRDAGRTHDRAVAADGAFSGFERIRAEAVPSRRGAWPASRTGIGARLRRLVGWAP